MGEDHLGLNLAYAYGDLTGQSPRTVPPPGAFGVVRGARFVRCFWPKLDRPTALFADGSGGLYVEGPPTPRNVVFPEDTVFGPGTRGDCFFVVGHHDLYEHEHEERVLGEEEETKDGVLRRWKTVRRKCSDDRCGEYVAEVDVATARKLAAADLAAEKINVEAARGDHLR